MSIITFNSNSRNTGTPSDYEIVANGWMDFAGLTPVNHARGLRLDRISLPDTIVNVSSENYWLDFYEGAFGVLSCSVPVTYYTSDGLATALAAAMTAKSAADGCGNVYTISFDSITQIMRIAATGGGQKPFAIRCRTGPHATKSLWRLIGATDISGGPSVGSDVDSSPVGGVNSVTMISPMNMMIAPSIFVRVFLDGVACARVREFSTNNWCTFSIPHTTVYGSLLSYDASRSVEAQIIDLDPERQQRARAIRFQIVDSDGRQLDIQNSSWTISFSVV